MAYSNDQLILRNGQTLSGKVLKNEFRIKTAFGDVSVKKECITHLNCMRSDGTGHPETDEIRTYAGDYLKGKLVQTQSISFVSADNNQTERIARDRVHSIIFIDTLDTPELPDSNA